MKSPSLKHSVARSTVVIVDSHTFGLRHCMDWRCVMASSHAVERLDVKGAEFCSACRKTVIEDGYW